MNGASAPGVSRPGRGSGLLVILWLAATARMAGILFVAPSLGLPDNGDWAKIMGVVGLRHTAQLRDDSYFKSVDFRLQVARPGWWHSGWASTETALAWLARTAWRPGPREIMDLRTLGGLHAAIYALGLLLAGAGLRSSWPRFWPVPTALLYFAMTDACYVAPFNSIFSQVASLLSLILAVGFGLHLIRSSIRPVPAALGYFAAVLLFALSKPQDALPAIFLALAGAAVLRGGGAGNRRVALAGLLAVGVAAGVYLRFGSPAVFRRETRYSIVYDEILPHAADPARALADFELPVSTLTYSGIFPSSDRSPLEDVAFDRVLDDRVGFFTILRYWCGHPLEAYESVSRSVDRWGIWPRGYASSSRGDDEAATRKRVRESPWTRARTAIVHSSILVVFGGALLAAVELNQWRRNGGPEASGAAILGLGLLTAAALEFLTCSLGTAHVDIGRHFYVFSAMFDILLVGIVSTLLFRVWQRFPRREP